MDALGYAVVWPLHRRHYLTFENHEVTDAVTVEDATSVDPSLPPDAVLGAPGRVVAARALLAAGCTHTRVGALLRVSKRTVARCTRAHAVAVALRDPEVLSLAREALANTVTKGSTAEERAGAVDWLEAQVRQPAPSR